MRVRITSARWAERQGGVTTYLSALRTYLPLAGVDIVGVSDDYDVLLHVGPHAYDGMPSSCGRRSVVVVHDLIPEILHNDESVRRERARALAAADDVIAISEWTKADVIREYGVDPRKIHVVYHGVSNAADSADANSVNMPFRGKRYLLYVGKRNEYKRFRWFLRAVASLMWVRPSLRLLCTGEPFCRREWAWIIALGLWGRVKARRFAAEEMAGIYRQACALVYPSSYEGFGLPLLEAMAAGCPVVCSRSTCLPEIAGEAAAYFNQDDSKELRVVLRRFLGTSDEQRKCRAASVEMGHERAKLFSWEKCARETARVLTGGAVT